ncbi:extracellular solute-binding protein [[Actinomadura] parvosata]|uniref:extracellular solute-binding protein n=1 Tax=[Actinomadura] parvosata TaxID=1955412 RepID=UPI00406C3320
MTSSPQGATTRRGFLGLAGLTALAAACSPPPGQKPGAAKATAETVDKLTALVPKLGQNPVAIKPDIAGVPVYGRNGFLQYPMPPIDAVTARPGKGGHYKAQVPTWSPLPPALGDNSFYDAVNADLGATLEFQFIDGMTILDKIPPLLAAGDVADIITIPSWIVEDHIPDAAKAIDRLFENLTPYLKGDRTTTYPLLSTIPTEAWQWSIWNGKLMAVPSWPEPAFGLILLHRKDIWDQLGLGAPKSADELFEMGRQATDPKNRRWAFGDIFLHSEELFRVPKKWRYEGGKLVHRFETPEYAATVEFARKLFDNELVHPDVVANKAANYKDLFKSGQILVMSDGPAAWTEMLIQMGKENPGFWLEAFPPFGGDGGKPEYRIDTTPDYTFIKKGTPKEKIEEILAIFDYLSAPFGTAEQLLMDKGVEGRHFTRDADGAPQPTELGQKEIVGSYNWLGGRIGGIYESEAHPDYVKTAATWWNDAVQYRHKDPFEGIRVQQPSSFTAATRPFEDKVNDIVRGRSPLSDLGPALDTWRRAGGEEGRTFYMKVLQDNGRA